MFRCFGEKNIKTVKIINAGTTEIYCEDSRINPNFTQYDLQITLRDGTVRKEYLVLERTLFWKYGKFINNPQDENYEHNSQFIDRDEKKSCFNMLKFIS